jgi:hypothetical protein
MNHAAMVRYLAGELRLPPDDVDRIVRAFTDALATHGAAAGDGDVDIEIDALVRAIVEQTMLPRPRVERTIEAMLELRARLDDALGAGET